MSDPDRPGGGSADTRDARFEEVAPSADRPLRLKAETEDDLAVISSLVQDAVGTVGDISWARGQRRLILLLNRLRWEDVPEAERAGRHFERVRTMLSVEDVTRVRSRGLTPEDNETVFALLALSFEAGEDGSGTLSMTLAGDGEIRAEVECLDVHLADVTRPWTARTSRLPDHED